MDKKGSSQIRTLVVISAFKQQINIIRFRLILYISLPDCFPERRHVSSTQSTFHARLSSCRRNHHGFTGHTSHLSSCRWNCVSILRLIRHVRLLIRTLMYSRTPQRAIVFRLHHLESGSGKFTNVSGIQPTLISHPDARSVYGLCGGGGIRTVMQFCLH